MVLAGGRNYYYLDSEWIQCLPVAMGDSENIVVVMPMEGLSSDGLLTCERHAMAEAFDTMPGEIKAMLAKMVPGSSYTDNGSGMHAIYRFPNGYGASVVNLPILTMGQPYEMMGLFFPEEGEEGRMAGDIVRGTADDINGLLGMMASLPPPVLGVLAAMPLLPIES